MRKKIQAETNPTAHCTHLSRQFGSRPFIFDASNVRGKMTLKKLLASGKVAHLHDAYRLQLRELFAIDNPPIALSGTLEKAFAEYHAKLLKKSPEWKQGRWAFFPWISTLVHILPDEEFQRVRTARNRTLISEKEQKRFYDATIAIAGLSIGNSVALAIALQGGGRTMKLADFDTMDLSNLNRIRAGVDSLGVPKVNITARQIYLINPYAEIELFDVGLNEKNISDFFDGADLVIDEFDNFAIKRLIREYARERRVPLISGADVGESAVVDIERYDINAKTKPFHGRVPNKSFEEMKGLDKRAIGGMIANLVGFENHNIRMLEWPKHMGQPGGIISFPQLGGMALLNGSLVAYCAYAMLTGMPIKNGRATLSLERLFLDPKYFSPKLETEHASAVNNLKKMLNI